ncbi:MAG: DNA polymerase III subunit alpha [Candidatus Terrybacteria bacterium]|nr:DNA polymerase III subunit alpha [Candidatus Terrybacteria bacterium]
MNKFIHLHTHSHYSLLDGLPKINELVNEAGRLEMSALALTDHGNMYGTIEFYKKCRKAGIKPIIGAEIYLAYESMHQKRPNIDDKRYHLVLLAENEIGYKNLIQLVTIGHLEGFYYKPRVDKETLRKYSEGLIALSACMAGEVSRMIELKKIDEAEKAAKEYEEIFGKGNFFIEIGHHPNIENYMNIQRGLIDLGQRLNIPLVATQDVHYIKSDDAQAQDFLVAIQTNKRLEDEDRLTMKGDNYSMRSSEEMADLFKNQPEAIENTVKIAERCNLELKLGAWVFPKIDLPENKTAEEYLRELVEEGYKIKFGNDNNDDARKRMEYELKIINTKGYAPYFLVVADIMNFAREREIIHNTRGSAAGSFISYLIGITNIDPIKYELPFERFLNPYRPSPPDIDMDFADDRREEIIDYVKNKYEDDKVAQIGTFGTIMARAAVRDITRVLGKLYAVGDRISKMIPFGSQGFPMTIEQALRIVPELRQSYETEDEVREILDLSEKIEGRARHISVHAAGVVIAPTKLTDYVPLQREPNGEKIITQYDMHAIEDVGLLKIDFLGIKNLAILGNSVKLVKKIHGIDVNLENLLLDDKKTFDLLAKGETIGVFQLAGSGMTRWLKELKPTDINDIMAMIALFRPGPMANISNYIKRKHGKEPITYLDPRLEKILKKTYGVATYQEDVLLIAIELAGYNWETVDKFRKAIGKKIPAEMAKQEKIFIDGCQKYGGLSPEKAEELWKLFDPFKGYGFNKAHAASYAIVAYQTAYMKANFPMEFMASVLTADAGDTEKIATAVNECRRMGIEVLPPDVNESFGDFTALEKSIRFGLYSIKNLGKEIAGAVIDERKKNGPFKSYSDFLDRVHHKNLNKKSLEALIKSGAMDALGERNQMLENIDEALEYNRQSSKLQQNQNSLFSLMADHATIPDLKLKQTHPASPQEKLLWEKELLGLYLSGHPLDKFKDKMEKIKTKIHDAKKMENGLPVVTVGMIDEIRKVMTKRNEPMLFIKLSDYTDSIEMVAFPRILNQYGEIIREGNCIAVKGKISLRNNEPSIIVEEMKEMKN